MTKEQPKLLSDFSSHFDASTGNTEEAKGKSFVKANMIIR
jgi:hypothetical protein